MDDQSPRFGLPFLLAGQAQKEALHNEALTLLDLAIDAVAETIGDDAPPTDPEIGRCWIVGTMPSGAWTGQAGALAGWTGGGWRLVRAADGMTVWVRALRATVRREAAGWSDGAIEATAVRIGGNRILGGRQPAIAGPAGGATIDTEARATLTTVLSMLQLHGLIA